jgi:antitoxin component of MazEF toxin-antitoxin module
MVMRVQRRGDEYCVVLSREVLEALRLTDGAEVEVRPVGAGANGAQASTEHRYATVEEGLEAFRATLPQHSEAYRELAKWPGGS